MGTPSYSATLSVGIFAACCGVLEAQMVAYRPGRKTQKGGFACAVVVGASMGLLAATAAAVVGLFFLFRAMTNGQAYVVGELLPQMYEFISRKSIEGYSFGV